VNVMYGASSGLTSAGAQQLSQGNAAGAVESGDRFGAALAAGNFDGDGNTDLAIGAPDESDGTKAGAGYTNVMYGTAAGLTGARAQQFNQTNAGGLSEAGDRFGAALATGNLNGDGRTDLVAGSPDETDGSLTGAGVISTMLGSVTGITSSGARQFNQSAVGGLSEAGDRFGAALTSANYDGDDYSDVVVGAPDEDDGSVLDTGVVNFASGSASALAGGSVRQFSQSDAAGLSEAGDRFGAAAR
jgi:hypothetical protein